MRSERAFKALVRESVTSSARGSVYVLRMPLTRVRSDVLIVAAHIAELTGVKAWLGESLAKRVHGLRVRCESVGVGMPAAAVGTMRALHATRPRALLLVGSCGVYGGSDRQLLAPAFPLHLQLVDAATQARQAALPPSMPVQARAHARLQAGLSRGQRDALRGTAATTLGITTSDALARRLARTSACEVENLEALSVALACESERVPFAAILIVTNIVGSRGRKQWADNQRSAADRGSRIIQHWLARGAPGLPGRR
jgi:nucleoside phosphorylase